MQLFITYVSMYWVILQKGLYQSLYDTLYLYMKYILFSPNVVSQLYNNVILGLGYHVGLTYAGDFGFAYVWYCFNCTINL